MPSIIGNLHDALQFHIEGMVQNGEPLPERSVMATYLTVPVPVAQDDVTASVSTFNE